MQETGSRIGCTGRVTWSTLMVVSTRAVSQREGNTGVEVSSGQIIDDTVATTIKIRSKVMVSLSGQTAASILACGMPESSMV